MQAASIEASTIEANLMETAMTRKSADTRRNTPSQNREAKPFRFTDWAMI